MDREKPSLNGRVIALTQPPPQAQKAGKTLEAMGGVPYYVPASGIKLTSDPAALKKFLWELHKGLVDYVVFNNANAVNYIFAAAEPFRLQKMLCLGLRYPCVVAVSPKTAQAAKEHNVRVDLMPPQHTQKCLLESFESLDLKGKKIRIPLSGNLTPNLTGKLREMGADAQEIKVCRSVPIDEELKDKFLQDLSSGKINAIVFGSALTAQNTLEMLTAKAPAEKVLNLFADKVTVVANAPAAQALKEWGIRVDVATGSSRSEKALEALAKFWSS